MNLCNVNVLHRNTIQMLFINIFVLIKIKNKKNKMYDYFINLLTEALITVYTTDNPTSQ